jgi:hypothetical protein
MSEAKYQPDFTLTIGGTDVTNYTEQWELQDVEDGIASLTVTIINRDGMFSGKFNAEDKVTIHWGTYSEPGPTIHMEVGESSENYTAKGIRSIVTARDCADRLTGASARGSFEDGSTTGAIKSTAEAMEMVTKGLDKVQDPKLTKEQKIHIFNERMWPYMRRLLESSGNPTRTKSKGGGGSGGVGKSGSAKTPLKGLRQPKKPKGFKGKVANGNLMSGGGGDRREALEKGDAASVVENQAANAGMQAATSSIRGMVELMGVPNIKAKKTITINNVGSKFSGKWYCRGVAHRWSTGAGYQTRCDLLASEVSPANMSENDQPMVMHADIYEENTLYCGPRCPGESQMTFTFGKDDKRIISFKGSDSPGESKGCGEDCNINGVFGDKPIPKNQRDTKPSSSPPPPE